MKQNVINMNIPFDQLSNRVCPCNCVIFVPAVTLKCVPALYSPSGKPETMILQSGFICAKCGAMMPLRPEDPRKEDSDPIIMNR